MKNILSLKSIKSNFRKEIDKSWNCVKVKNEWSIKSIGTYLGGGNKKKVGRSWNCVKVKIKLCKDENKCTKGILSA